MSTLSKALSILNLFDEERPVWTAEEIIGELDLSQPTGYRYTRELCAQGYLVRLSTGYILGPKIIELDYHIRQSDPILQGAQPIMRELTTRVGCDSLLMSIFGDQIVTTHQERGKEVLTISYGRGHPMPLFRGAGSKAIVASLSKAHRRRIYAINAREARQAGLGTSYESFEANMKKIRADRFALSRGELNKGNIGLASPVFQNGRIACGSLTLVMATKTFDGADQDQLIDAVKEAARRISSDVMQK